jgi:hypothetical protein
VRDCGRYRQADRQANRRTDEQTDRHVGRDSDRERIGEVGGVKKVTPPPSIDRSGCDHYISEPIDDSDGKSVRASVRYLRI